MLGAIIGDIIGSPYEFNAIKTTDFPLFSERSTFTDDTIMTVAIAAGLWRGYGSPDGSRRAIVDMMRYYGRRFSYAGYGSNFARWLVSKEPEPYGSYGNGAAMRISSTAWIYDTLEEVEDYAELTASVTHDHPEGVKGTRSVAAAILMARQGKTQEDIRSYISGRYGYDLNRTLDEIRPGYMFYGSCQQSVPESIIAFLESTSFEDAIRKAVSLGGDSDTMGAITGSIAEAFYKEIPCEIEDKAIGLLEEPLYDILQLHMSFLDVKKKFTSGNGWTCARTGMDTKTNEEKDWLANILPCSVCGNAAPQQEREQLRGRLKPNHRIKCVCANCL